MKIRLSKCVNYPEETPTEKVVGFSIFLEKNKELYFDTLVSLDLNKEEAIKQAWTILKPNIDSILNRKEKTSIEEDLELIEYPPVIDEKLNEKLFYQNITEEEQDELQSDAETE